MRSSASIGRYDLSCSQRPWLLACQRPSEGLQAGRRGGGGVKKNFPLRVAEVRAKLAPGTPVEVWFQDEMRVGQKNKLTYRWARKGSRPRAIHDQRTQSTYVFGAVCPGAEAALPSCCPLATPRPCSSISTKSQRKSPPAHTPFSFSIKPDGTAPKTSRLQKTISIVPLPPRAPELNPQENIWQFMRAKCLPKRTSNSIVQMAAPC